MLLKIYFHLRIFTHTKINNFNWLFTSSIMRFTIKEYILSMYQKVAVISDIIRYYSF